MNLPDRKRIRVLIVEDSPVVADLLEGILGADPEIRVIARARNGREAVDLCHALKPDVVTMDIRMPVMDGFEATETIMTECPTPILVVSSAVAEEELNIAFNAVRAGAMDVVEKPRGCFSREYVSVARDILSRIKLISRIRPIRRHRRYTRAIREQRTVCIPQVQGRNLLAIAASTGGPAALAQILSGLPPGFPWPVLVVQHIAPGFLEGFAHWLDTQTALQVEIGRPGVRPVPGHLYLAAEGHHLGVEPGGRLVLDPSAPVDGHRPSATYLFRNVASVYGANAVGVILTGMGRDGAAGLLELYQAGACTIAQDRESSLIYGMPRAAVESGAVQHELPLARIADRILRLVEQREGRQGSDHPPAAENLRKR